MSPKIVIGFVPFLLFDVLGRWVQIGWAAAAALLAAVVLIAATARGGVKPLPVMQGVILLAVTLAAALGGPGVEHFLALNARGGASLLVGLFIVATAATAPFTASFAKNSVPEEYWTSPVFLATNRDLSRAWGLAVLTVGVCHIVGAHIDVHNTRPLLSVAVEWVLPILAPARAVTYTQRVIARRSATPAAGARRS